MFRESVRCFAEREIAPNAARWRKEGMVEKAAIVGAGTMGRGKHRAIVPEEIVNRRLDALVNQGADILEAGIAARAGDIDGIYVTGYGFPAYRSGPMFWAD